MNLPRIFQYVRSRLLEDPEFQGGGDGGTSLPDGGDTGEILTKQSNADGDADWEPLVFDGGGA